MNKITRLFNLLIIAAFFLSACNLPTGGQGQNASVTAAAQTVEALLSATPVSGVVIPSNTPIPAPATLTPIPQPVNTNPPAATATSNCNVAQFISDPTIPDGTIMTPGQTFLKKWRIKNIGSCTWTGFLLVFDSGDSMGAPASKPISDVGPGQEIDLEVSLTAPTPVGSYRGYFRITTNGGVLVPIVSGHQGRTFYVDIKVQLPVTVAPAFAVSSASVTSGGTCGAFTATASITANGGGSVTYHWVRSDGAIDGASHPAIVFTSAGTQTVSTTWSTSSTGTYWIDIYIDTPNNQQFGRANFTCP
ncbi:MAG: hypothetical protein HZB50_11650 [Chloroflexi bacterium]|nr:hypothetical protein [Chloroflexota bacterium]